VNSGTKWAAASGLVIIATLVAMATPATGALYERIYPADTPVLEAGDTIEKAVTKASLKTGWDHEPLTQDVASRFTATIFYDTRAPLPGLPVINVAYANDATLKPSSGKFDIVPVTDSRRYLNEGTRRPGGGFRLSWAWDVVPRSVGRLVLILQIQPLVLVRGTSARDLELRNKPIPIRVAVNPNRDALDRVFAAAQTLRITAPSEMRVGRSEEIEADLPMRGRGRLVHAEVALDRAESSAAATIEEAEVLRTADETRVRWRVTPDEIGPVDLLFTVALSTSSGDAPVMKTVSLHRSLRAKPAPPSIWSRLQAPALFLAPFVALAPLVAFIVKRWSARRREDEARLAGPREDGAGADEK
jgi:hypothetical protein